MVVGDDGEWKQRQRQRQRQRQQHCSTARRALKTDTLIAYEGGWALKASCFSKRDPPQSIPRKKEIVLKHRNIFLLPKHK
jgi:hypothetical protein